MAESQHIELVLPAFSGSEPYERMVRRAKDRKALNEGLASEIKELARSSPYSNIDDTARSLTAILSQSASEEKIRLDHTLLRLTNISRMIPLTSEVLRLSIQYQDDFALSPQDAIVFASVISDLQTIKKEDQRLFVTRNKGDFLNPDISDLLSTYSCKLLFTFENAVGYVRSVIRPPSTDPAK